MMRLLPFIVFIYILSSCEGSNESMFREDCWESYATVKLCIPLYEKCLISMGTNCSGVFSKCVRNHHISKSSEVCSQHLQNYTEMLENNKASYVESLLKRITSQEGRNSKMCDVSLFQHHNVLSLNFSTLAMIEVDKLPQLILSYCQCPEQPGRNSSSTELFPQSRLTSIPIHFWYGGLQNFKCWKEIDRNLAETLCDSEASLLINHEWAKREDCLENPTAFNCSIKFTEGLLKILAKSKTPLFCSVYVEISMNLALFAENTSFDYKIVYTDSDVTEGVNYRDDELYLIKQSDPDIDIKCFEGKRTLNSYTYCLHHCKKIPQDECEGHCIKYLKEESGLSYGCVTAFMPEKKFVKQLFGFLWKHKGTICVFCIGVILITCFKKLRDWIVKELGIRTCMCLTRRFDAATIYFDDLMPKDTIITEAAEMRAEQNNVAQDDENNEKNEGELLPIDTPSTSSDSMDEYIQEETDCKIPENNQTPNDFLLNAPPDPLGKNKSSTPKEKPKLLSAFKSLCWSFLHMSESMGKVFYTRCLVSGYDYAKQKTFGSRNQPETIIMEQLCHLP